MWRIHSNVHLYIGVAKDWRDRMVSYFDEAYYLKSKLAQLNSVGEKDSNGNAYTLSTLRQAIIDANMTLETHYQQYGSGEGLNPNPYFNEVEYLQAKLNQLNSIDERDANGNAYDLQSLKMALAEAGMTAVEHYEQYGSHETDAAGNLLNPSNAFDANAYAAAKLYQLQHSGTAEEKVLWAGKTAADVVQAIAAAGMSLVTHYAAYGAAEASSNKTALVQTVPVAQRVGNDPARAGITGEIVPANYNAPSEAPKNVTSAEAAPVTKPADMGGKVSADISPVVQAPAAPVAVPGDENYVAPPAGIVDTNANPVVLVTDSTGNTRFGVQDSNGSIIAVDDSGKPTGTVIGAVSGGIVTPVAPVSTPDSGGSAPTPATPASPPAPAELTAEFLSGTFTVYGPAAGDVTVNFGTDGVAQVTQGENLVTVPEGASNTTVTKVDVGDIGSHQVKIVTPAVWGADTTTNLTITADSGQLAVASAAHTAGIAYTGAGALSITHNDGDISVSGMGNASGITVNNAAATDLSVTAAGNVNIISGTGGGAAIDYHGQGTVTIFCGNGNVEVANTGDSASIILGEQAKNLTIQASSDEGSLNISGGIVFKNTADCTLTVKGDNVTFGAHDSSGTQGGICIDMRGKLTIDTGTSGNVFITGGNGTSGGYAINNSVHSSSEDTSTLVLTGWGNVSIAGGTATTDLGSGKAGAGFAHAVIVDASTFSGQLTATGSAEGDTFILYPNISDTGNKIDRLVYTDANQSHYQTLGKNTFDTVRNFAVGDDGDTIDLCALQLTYKRVSVTTENSVTNLQDGAPFTISTSSGFFTVSGTQYGVVYTQLGDNIDIFIDADGNGNWDAATDMVIQLTGTAGPLSAENFVFTTV